MNIFYKIIFFLSLAQSLVANTEAVNVNFSAICLETRIMGLTILNDGQTEEVNVLRKSRSKMVNYRGLQTIYFYEGPPTINPETQQPTNAIAQLKLPSPQGTYLLIFYKSTDTKYKYNVKAIPDDQQRFPAGTFRFINLCPFDIALKLDDEITKISAQQVTNLAPKFSQDDYQKVVMVSIPEGKKHLQAYDGFLYCSKNLRTLCFITPKNDLSGRINFKAIQQYIGD